MHCNMSKLVMYCIGLCTNCILACAAHTAGLTHHQQVCVCSTVGHYPDRQTADSMLQARSPHIKFVAGFLQVFHNCRLLCTVGCEHLDLCTLIRVQVAVKLTAKALLRHHTHNMYSFKLGLQPERQSSCWADKVLERAQKACLKFRRSLSS